MAEEKITVSKGTVKAVTGRFIVFDREWLLDHLDTEVELLKKTREHRKEYPEEPAWFLKLFSLEDINENTDK